MHGTMGLKFIANTISVYLELDTNGIEDNVCLKIEFVLGVQEQSVYSGKMFIFRADL